MQIALTIPKCNNGYAAISYCDIGIILVKQNQTPAKPPLEQKTNNAKNKITAFKKVNER